jgi:hypothetical protein
VGRGGSVRGRKLVSARRCGTAGSGGGGAASRKRRPAGGEAKEEEGVGDRKEGTTEETVEQRALYTHAKRREGAIPDRVRLNPKRQRTGTETT